MKLTATDYACGFLFGPKDELVLLLRKNRPLHMAGRWNGVGGKVNPNELPIDAMDREAEEEIGLSDLPWRFIASLSGRLFRVSFFYAQSARIEEAQQRTDEEIRTFMVANLAYQPQPLVANVPLMIALATDRSGISKPVHFSDNTNYSRRPR